MSTFVYEKENIVSVGFADRKLGFFETAEEIVLVIKYKDVRAENGNFSLSLTDAWGELYKTYEVTAQAGARETLFSLGSFGKAGFYRLHLTLAGKTEDINDYLAIAVCHAHGQLDGTVAADVAAEYEPRALAVTDELIKSLKLQGFDYIRGRGAPGGFEKAVLQYREKLEKAGIRQTTVNTKDMLSFPKIRELDLRRAYRYFKELKEKDPVDSAMVELQNEAELFFNAPPLPDSLAAYSKAAAIGLHDSEADSLFAMCSTAYCADGFFYDISLQNGILDYSSIYNFHGYGAVENKAVYARKSALAYSPKGHLRPAYMTENGYKVWADENGISHHDQMMEMCRYAVKNSAKMFAEGTDKWFWFIARAFLESGGGFGNAHAWTQQPYPIAVTLSTLTRCLGKGIYRGRLSSLPEKCYGHVFDRGDCRDALILFAAKDEEIKLKIASATLSDMFGKEEILTADENGYVTVKCGYDPVLLTFDGRLSETQYYKSAYELQECEKITFSKAQRVVINPIWDDQNLSDGTLLRKGYLVEAGKSQNILFRIYNLNDAPIEGEIFITPEYKEHIEVVCADASFKIEPWGRVEIPVKLHFAADMPMNSAGDVLFGAKLSDGACVSSAVSRYWYLPDDMKIADEDIKLFEDYTDLENWNLENIEQPGRVTAETDPEKGTITICADHGEGYAQWYFPEYFVKNPEIFANSDGIVLRRTHSCDAKADITVFVCDKDGREYYSGVSSGVRMTADEKTAIFPWDVFMLHTSKEGFNDPRAFDPKNIYMVRVGASGTPKAGIPDMTLWDFGVYHDERNYTAPHPGAIAFGGVENGKHYESAEDLKLTATLPETVIDDIRLTCGKSEYPFTVEGNLLTADLSGLGRGEYVFHVSGRTAVNYRYTNYVTFYIEK